MDRFKGWKTVIFNVLLGVEALLELAIEGEIVPPEWMAAALVLGNLILRYKTTTAIGRTYAYLLLLMLALTVASACSTMDVIKATDYRLDGSIERVVETEKQRTFVQLPTTDSVQGQSADGFYATIMNVLTLGYGGVTRVNAPTDADVEVSAGLKLDAEEDKAVSFDRRMAVGQYAEDSE